MTAEELLRWLTNGLFVALTAAVVVRAVRERRRLAVDTAVLFGVLGYVILQGVVLGALGIRAPALVQDAAVILVVALPYLTLRLVEDFAPVDHRAMGGALVFLGAIAIGVLATPDAAMPPWLLVPLVAGFLGLEAYAAWSFARAARTYVGATRERLRFASAGTLLLGLAVLVAGAAATAPGVIPLVRSVLALASGLAYFIAFVPPSLLQRAWREPLLRAFLVEASIASAAEGTSAAVAHLERGIAAALGATEARIGLVEADGAVRIAGASDDAQALAAEAIAIGRAVERDAHGRSRLAAPVRTASRKLGAVVVKAPRATAFVDDSLAMLELVAHQAAVILEGARLRDEVGAASQAKSEFLANMSHELRTPLNAVLGFAALLREQRETDESKRVRYLDHITAAGEHLLALINDVLDLSKVEAGKLELRPDRTTVAALAGPAVAAATSAAEAGHVAFAAQLDGESVVRVDADRIRQVLFNLLSNAVKFTPDGGRVSLRIAASGPDLEIAVSDTGIGIPPDRHARVFGAFERLNEDRSDVPGTGLGLALTKRIVELHGGSIDFTSVPGSETTFRVRVPAVVEARIDGARVLIVEDEARDAELVAALAARHGLQVEIVATVAGGCEALERGRPLALVLDLRLPDGRGEDVLERLRGARDGGTVPVAVVTVEDDAPRARALGAGLVMTKPLVVQTLADWFEKLDGRREPVVQAGSA